MKGIHNIFMGNRKKKGINKYLWVTVKRNVYTTSLSVTGKRNIVLG
jgi:hypothetical protein